MKAAERVQGLREFLGMSRQEFADFLNVSAVTVWRWEGGDQEPKSTAASVLEGIFSLLDEINELPEQEADLERRHVRRLLRAAGDVQMLVYDGLSVAVRRKARP